jgi:hypothetical protein
MQESQGSQQDRHLVRKALKSALSHLKADHAGDFLSCHGQRVCALCFPLTNVTQYAFKCLLYWRNSVACRIEAKTNLHQIGSDQNFLFYANYTAMASYLLDVVVKLLKHDTRITKYLCYTICFKLDAGPCVMCYIMEITISMVEYVEIWSQKGKKNNSFSCVGCKLKIRSDIQLEQLRIFTFACPSH